MEKTLSEKAAIEVIKDESFSDLSYKKWLVEVELRTYASIEEIAMYSKYPTLSIAAFSKIRTEDGKVALLRKLIRSNNNENIISIAHEVLLGIDSKALLWDIYSEKNATQELKAMVERRIDGNLVPPRSTLIRTDANAE